MRKFLIAGAAAGVIVASAAAAQTAPPAPQPRFAKTESRADVQAHVQKMFARLDTNRDGFITKAEADAAQAQSKAKWQQRREQRAEGPGFDHSKAFDRIDANHDGSISRDEFAAAPRPQHMGMRMAGMHRGFAGHMFEMADVNKDGRVSVAEAQQLALQHFDRADLNHDGTLTPDERRQAHELMRSQRHPS